MRPHPAVSRHGGGHGAGDHRRAEDRWPVLLAALRGRRAGAGGDAGRRLRGRGRHHQCPHHPADPPPARGQATGRARGSRRDLYDQGRFRRGQRAPGRGRQAGLRQPAQRRRRLVAPARFGGDGVPAAAVLRLCLGRGKPAAGGHADGHGRRLQALRPAGQSADGLVRRRRGPAGTVPRDRDAACGAALRYRRCRLQGRLHRPAGAARRHLARAALGGGAQVSRRTCDDGAASDRDPGRPHRVDDAGGASRPRHGRRRGRHERHLA